jgi:hypothetical protein
LKENDREYNKKAIEKLIMKLKNKPDVLDALIIAVSSQGEFETKCVTIKGTKSKQMQVNINV